MPGPRNFEFERFLRGEISSKKLGGIAGVVLMFALGSFFLYWGIKLPFIPIIVIGLLPFGAVWLMLYRFRGDMKGEEYWINLFVNEPARIVWIKPVKIRHTAYHVITLYTEQHYQVCTDNGISILIKCNSPEHQLLFVRGLIQYVPHVQYGYHKTLQAYYRADPKNFLNTLKGNGIYLPIKNFEENIDAGSSNRSTGGFT